MKRQIYQFHLGILNLIYLSSIVLNNQLCISKKWHASDILILHPYDRVLTEDDVLKSKILTFTNQMQRTNSLFLFHHQRTAC